MTVQLVTLVVGGLLINGRHYVGQAEILVVVYRSLGDGQVLYRVKLLPKRAAGRGSYDLGHRDAAAGGYDHQRVRGRGRPPEHPDFSIRMQRPLTG
jgi:hypothetical protein